MSTFATPALPDPSEPRAAMSLRVRLIALFVLLAVLPLVAIGIYDYTQSMRALETLISTELGAIAEQSAVELRQQYALRESELLLFAENVETQRLYRAHAGGHEREMRAARVSTAPFFRQAWEVLGSSYRWVEFRDVNGVVLSRLPGDLGNRALDFGGAAGTADPANLVVVVRPILGDGSAQLGTLRAAIHVDKILPHQALAVRFGNAGYSMVADRARGTVVYHPSHAVRYQSLDALMGADGWDIDLALLEREEGTVVYRDRDSTRIAAFRTLTDPPWTVLATASVDEFSAPFVSARARNLILVLMVAAAISVAVVLVTRRETRSLVALTAAADEVGAGNFAPTLPAPGSSEVRRLSAAFALMVAKVSDMLEQIEANRHMAAVGEFASQISHEIRNPLTSLKLNLQSLDRDARRGCIPGDSARPLEICLREIRRLDWVVSGVLDLARPRAAGREPRSLHGMLDEALEVVGAEFVERGVAVEKEYRAKDDVVRCNAEELNGVFLNLFLNAAEAMPDGGALRISTTGPTGTSDLEIRIADEGPGIPDALREEVFKPFYSTKEEGTGLGLSLALRTVEEHGGRLRVDEIHPPGRGAELVVQLPLATGASEP